MNAEQLLQHFERISDAPDAIKTLRGFILDLAVRGKLVEQDSGEEVVTVLLDEIKSRMRRLRKTHVFSFVGPSDIPFALPPGWTWCRIGEACEKSGSGSTPRGGKDVYKKNGIPFLRSQNIYNDGLRLDDVVFIDDQTHQRMSGTRVLPCDLLLNITGGSIGRCAKVPVDFGEANISQHVAIIRLAARGIEDYIHWMILSPYFQSFVDKSQTGAGRGGLPKNRMDSIPIPLPPLAEQHRIVAKVDELMKLCDQLEAAKAEREKCRDSLVAASLQRLNQPAEEKETFRKHARFTFNNLSRITTRAVHIKQLRQTILNLAVRGKLVEQDPSDEPATELLKRIVSETPQSKSIEARNDPWPYILPECWTWTRFGRLISKSDAGWSPKTENYPRSGENWGVLKVSAVSWDEFRPWENKQVLPGTEPRAQAVVKLGDFLISRANTAELIGRAVIVNEEPVKLMMSDKIVRLYLSSKCNPRYLWMVNNYSDSSRTHYARGASGVSPSMKNISRDVILNMPLPLPPLAEQHRIVAKVEELMSHCDQLEAQITATEQDSRRFLESVLADALPLASGSARRRKLHDRITFT